MPGEDRAYVAQRARQGNAWILVYPRYVLQIRASREVGETTFVYRRLSTEPATRSIRRNPILIASDDEGWFFGVSGDLLFIDRGCCPGARSFTVYDVSRARQLFTGEWFLTVGDGTPNLRKRRWLTYWEPIDPPPSRPACPEVDSMRAAGTLGDITREEEYRSAVVYREKVTLDLLTAHKERSGIVGCEYQE